MVVRLPAVREVMCIFVSAELACKRWVDEMYHEGLRMTINGHPELRRHGSDHELEYLGERSSLMEGPHEAREHYVATVRVLGSVWRSIASRLWRARWALEIRSV
jgi:hypothetical protein